MLDEKFKRREFVISWLEKSLLNLVEVLLGVLVAHVWGRDVQFKVWSEILEVVVVGQLIGDLDAQGNRCFVGPTPNLKKILVTYMDI